jgi:hypothetical protein
MGCKDITVFRDTSIKDQVLVTKKRKNNKESQSKINHPSPIKVNSAVQGVNISEVNEHPIPMPYPSTSVYKWDYMTREAKTGNGDNCPICESEIFFLEGCLTCSECGWGLCS